MSKRRADKTAWSQPKYAGSCDEFGPTPSQPLAQPLLLGTMQAACHALFQMPTALERPDSWSVAPTRPIHSASPWNWE